MSSHDASLNVHPTCSMCKIHNIDNHLLFVTTPEPHELAFHVFESDDDNNDNVPVIAVHGLTRTSHDFDEIARVLKHQGTVYCLDMPGRGRSQPLALPEHYSYNTYVNDVFSFLSYANLGSVNWIGSSMGGILGMLIASRPNSPIKKLVLNDIGYFIPFIALKQISENVSQTGPFRSYELAAQHLRNVYAQFGFTTEEEWNHFVEVSVKKVDDNYYLHYDPAIASQFQKSVQNEQDIDLWQIWETIDIPVLVLRGEESIILPKEVADKMGEKDNCTVAEIKNCGHCPSLTSREHIDLIAGFFSR
ncbi:hypothetical protein P9112_001506 [Eukaryota sp. TZLM1-RC]